MPAHQTREGALIRMLYGTLPGRLLLQLLVKPWASNLAGAVLSSPISRPFIAGFIRRNGINVDEYEPTRYRSFNDFFTRRLKPGSRPLPAEPDALCAPCDGWLSTYRIAADQRFLVKGLYYDIQGLLADDGLADELAGGVCLVFRLTPADCHRYAYIDDGELVSHRRIPGVLHSVRPMALGRYQVFAQNTREYTVLQTESFGKLVQVEVGALMVGRISNHKTTGTCRRGEEKGYFEFGGSTVMLLFPAGAVALDEALLAAADTDSEVQVRLGSKIGRSLL